MTAATLTDEPGGAVVSFSDYAQRFGRGTIAIMLGSLPVGLVILGLGGRLIMKILAVTSPPTLDGAITDNGNRITEFTVGGTMEIVVFVGLFGAVGLMLLFVSVRGWLPASGWRRRGAFAAIAAVIGGAVAVDPGNKDFALVRPVWLGIALFILLPGVAGLVEVLVVDRLDAAFQGTPFRWWWIPLAVPTLLLALVGGLVALYGLVLLLGGYAFLRSATGRRIWSSAALRVVGRLALVAIVAFAGFDLVRDIGRIDSRDPAPSDFREPE